MQAKTFSDRHIAAWRKYQRSGSVGLDDGDVEAIAAEDPEMGAFIRDHRASQRPTVSAPAGPEEATPSAKAQRPPFRWTQESAGDWAGACFEFFKSAERDEKIGVSAESLHQRIDKHPGVSRATFPFLPILHIVRIVNQRLVSKQRRLDALEARLAAVESRGPSVEYAGVFEPGRAYGQGALCTRSGGLWLALRATTDTPGDSSGSWKLIVKAGRAE